MTKIYTKVVSKVLTIEQKENGKRICSDIWCEEDPSFLDNDITCDKTSIFQYDPLTQKQSTLKNTVFAKNKKARQSKSKFKGMLIDFFDINNVILAEMSSRRIDGKPALLQTNSEMKERVRRKRPELWKNEFILHQDNAPPYNVLTVKQYLIAKNVTVLKNPPYSPDLASCDFFLFLKIKTLLKETHFGSVDAIKKRQPYYKH